MEISPKPERTVPYRGRIFRITQTRFENGKVFEIAERAPGVRIIIDDKANGKILLSREFRHEINGYDYRLPGGKVFDRLEDYEAFDPSKLLEQATEHAKVEAKEEVGIDVISLAHIGTSTLGATVKWDLYIFASDDWTASESHQSELAAEGANANQVTHEDISVSWVLYDEVKQMILDGRMSEERVALWLLRYLDSK